MRAYSGTLGYTPKSFRVESEFEDRPDAREEQF
jgi:hypothetical protein